jgi:Ca2+-binding RTX toxin-like protein
LTGAGDDTIFATPLDGNLTPDVEWVIAAGGGDDFIDLSESDRPLTVIPGSGNDRIMDANEATTVVLVGTPAADTITAFERFERLICRVNEDRNLITFSGLNELQLFARAGDDRIALRRLTVPVLVNAGLGDDTVDGSRVFDAPLTLRGGAGADDLIGGFGPDDIFGGPGDDTLTGGRGEDLLDGGLGNDTLIGNANIDLLLGRGGDDLLFGGRGPDVLLGGPGNDTLSGGAGRDVLVGRIGNDRLSGGSGNDFLFGGPGDDVLSGGSGDDRINGGSGYDIVSGTKPSPEPVAYWRLNETGGSTAVDSFGLPQDGIYYGWIDKDDPGAPAAFDTGTSAEFWGCRHQYIAVAHSPEFETAEGTVQFWFNTDRTWGDQTLFSKDHVNFVTGGHLNIGLDGSRLEVRLQSTDHSFYIKTDPLIHRHTWYHVAFSFGAGGMKLYLNGELVGENDYSGGLAGNREPIAIGGSLMWNNHDSGDLSRLRIKQAFDGHIDEVAFFDVALDEGQIQRAIDAGAGDVGGGADSGALSGSLADYKLEFINNRMVLTDTRPVSPAVLAYWPLNEVAGQTAVDIAGDPQNANYIGFIDKDDPGAPAGFDTGTAAEIWRSRYGYIAAAHDPVFEQAEGTIQLWFNTDRTWGDQTLFSKDHIGYETGGHLNIGMDGSRLEVRLQSTNQSHTIKTGHLIHSHTWYHLAFTFGAEGMQLYLNGELVGQNDYSGGLEGNREPIAIGASLMWNRYDGGNLDRLHVKRRFDGRIDEVAFFGQALDADQIRQVIDSGPLGMETETLSQPAPDLRSIASADVSGASSLDALSFQQQRWLARFLLDVSRNGLYEDPLGASKDIKIDIDDDN